MPADIITITLPTPSAGTTALGLRFSLTGTDPWTNYRTDATDPATGAQDLPISLLVGGAYVLDGLNGPTGNMAAASDPNNVFQARWLTSGAHSRWGPRFVILSPPLAAVWQSAVEEALQLLYVGGRGVPLPDALMVAGIRYELPRVIAFVEGPPAPDGTGGTGRSFTPVTEQRLFDGSARNSLRVYDLVPADQGGSAIAVVTMPGSGALTGTPVPLAVRNNLTAGWDRLELQWSGSGTLPVFPLGSRNIGVTAMWGYRATVPAPLAGAVAAEVARLVEVGAKVALAGAGETKSIGSYSINTSAGVSVWPQSSPIGVNHERFLEAMKMYRDPRALDAVRFGPAAVRALWGS